MKKPRRLIGLILLCGIFSLPAAESAARKPNILLIMVDDMNDWVGYLGANNQTKTPNIDRLAKMGVSFTRAYCAAPVCNPSRTALMSGLRPTTTGVYDNDDDWRDAVPVEKTLMHTLHRAGYTTINSGKVLHGKFPRPEEWDEYFNPSEVGEKDPMPKDAPGVGGIRFYPLQESEETMLDYRVASRAVTVLAEKHEKPFFLGVGLYAPHLPWFVPEKYFDLHSLEDIVLPPFRENDLDDVPEPGKVMAKPFRHKQMLQAGLWKQAVQGYLAAISFADAQVGRVLDAWEKSPERDNTLIVFVSDHGWSLGEKHHWQKSALWEKQTRAPMIWVVPGLTKPDGVCPRVVEFLSLYPTLMEICGLPAPDFLEGRSLMPLLKNPQAPWEFPALTTMRMGNHAVRDEQWRYIRYADGSEELYDTAKDPNEWINLAADSQYQEVKAKLALAFPVEEKPGVGWKKTRKRDRVQPEEE